MKKFLLQHISLIVILLANNFSGIAQSPANVTSTSPTANNDFVSSTSNVSITYNDIMIAPSASNTAMRVFGDKRGAYSYTGGGTYSGVNTATITYNPTRTFFPGELLSVINNGNTTNGIINSRPTNFNFWSAAGVGLAQFTSSTTSTLSLGNPDRDLYEIQNADLDNDGDLDIIFSHSNQFSGTSISYALNNGSGGFGASVNLIEGGACCFGNYVTSFTIGDYNHDGDVDIAVSYSVTDSGSIYYIARFSNNGAASFTQVDYTKTEQYDEMISVDMDGDGDLDIVGVNRFAGTINLVPNNVSGAFNLSNVLIANISGVYSIVAGDFNGDRRMDIASTRSTSSFIRISLQPASGTTYTTSAYASGTNTSLTKIKILDIEGDGDLDVAALNLNDDLVVFMLNAAGVLSTPTTVAATGMSNFDLADYDGDADFDLGFSAGNNSLQIYKNAAGVFSSFSNISLGTGAINNISQICSGDFDGDGDIDVVGKPPVQNPSFVYPLRLLRNSNNQVFTSAVASPTCVGNQITVSWTVSTTLASTNDFFIQLSDASGSFAAPYFLGSVFNSGTAGSLVVTIPNVTPGSGYRIRAYSNTPGVNSNDNGSNIQVLAGIDITVSAFCDINSTYLSASSGTSGVTYAWSPATGLDVTTGADVVAAPSSTTTYYVTGTSPFGCIDVDTVVVEPSCYCTTINQTGNCNAVNISQVVLSTLSNASGCSNLNGTAYNIYPLSGNTTTNLVIGNTYSFSVRNGGSSNCTKVAWFDWDKSGTFDVSEFTNLGANIPVNTTTTVTVTVPGSASSGVIGMRVREVLNGTTIGSGNSCTLYSSGETEDYFITLDYPEVTGLTPTENNYCHTTTANLVYTFNTAMSSTATASANYKINGFKKGLYTATASGAATSTITYNPTTNFKPGERVSVTLTTNMQSTSGVNMSDPIVYEFISKAGVGPATFLSEPISGTTAGTSGDIGVGDFSGDGNLDFVISIIGSSSTTLQYYVGNGAGGFASPVTLTTPQTNPLTIEPADWDNDGDLDFIVGYNNLSANQVTLFRNSSGTFSTVAISLGASSGMDIASADYDGDGDLDLVTVNAAGTDINFIRNNGAASFTLVDLTNTSTNNFIVVPGDFNSDNAYDIAVADLTNSQIDIYTLKIGSGFSLRTQITTSGLVTALKANDFDGDGILDLAWTQFFTDSVGFARGNGNFTFTSPFYYSLSDPSQMEAADYDGDCDLDLAISSTTADVYIMKNDGSGNFTNQIGQSGGFSPNLVKSGDFDGDADIDLVSVRNSSTTTSFLRNALTIITTGTIAGPLCNSPSISVPWTANTTLTNVTANVELSDAAGSFASPTILLSATLNGASGTISGVQIPIVTAAIGYRIRIVTTSITATSIDNGVNLGIGVTPNLTITSNCSGNNTLLGLSGASTYTWSPASGLSSTTAANVTAAPASPTIYTYFGKDAGGCQSTNYTVSVSNKCYCYPQFNNLCSSGDYISSVSLNTLTNNTGSCSGNEFNFTAIPTTTATTSLTRGSSYNLSVTPNGGSFQQGIGVWIDFNQDNDYSDAGEFVFASAPTLVTVNTTVLIPLSATLGLTRVRVRAMYNITPVASDACSLTDYGETEDYIVTVACTNPIVYNVTGGGTICDGVGVSVGLSNSESTTNYTLYLTGVSQGSLQGTGSPISFNGLTSAGTYTIQGVSASGCSATMNGTATITNGTALEVSSTNPVSNSASIVTNSNINTVFNTSLAAGAANQTYFKVYGKQTGLKTGAYSLIGVNTLRFNPTTDFKAGEGIDVTLVTGTPGLTCNLDTGYVYNLTAKAGVGPATFNPYSNPFLGGSIITGVTEADFNGDGRVDYAFIGRSTNNLAIALNSGSGNFTGATNIGLTGFQPSKINKGDFDNDGDIDLVIGASNSGVIRLYKNNGTGTFTLFSSNASAYGSNSDIEVADFNLNGTLDIVVTTGSGTIQIMQNDGTGLLTGMSVINSGFNHRYLAVIDFNKDGMPDVVATNTADSFIDFFENNQNASGLLTSNGTFSINTGIGAAGLTDIAVKDVDNDNDEDIVVSSIATGRIAVIKTNYPSASTVDPSVLVGTQAFQIATGDFDGDADIDIAVTDSSSTNTFRLLKNTAGTFATAITGTSYNAKYIAAADLDNDLDIDLVGVDFNGNNAFIKNEAVYITTVTSVASAPICAGGAMTVNWTNNQNFPVGNIFTIELSDASGSFAAPVILGTITSQTATTLSVTIPTSTVFSNAYQVRVTSNSSPSVAIALGSITVFDYPPIANVVGGGLYCGNPVIIGIDASDEIMEYDVYLNGVPVAGFQNIVGTGASMDLGSFTAAGTYTVIGTYTGTGCVAPMTGSVTISSGTSPQVTAVAPLQNSIDINRNSNIDITFNTSIAAIATYTSGVPIYVWGDKSGIIAGVWTLPSSTVMRFNPTNNLKPGEIVSITITTSTNAASGCNMALPYVFSFTVKGAVAPYNFVEQYTYNDGNTSSNKPVIADFNGDNILDVAYMNQSFSIYNLNVKLGQGLGALGATSAISTNGLPDYLGSADFDNDGDLDLYTVGNLDILIYDNDGAGNFTEYSTGIFTDYVTPTVADFNGDGYLDILANEFNAGNSVVYLNIGSNYFISYNSVSSYFNGVTHFHADFDNDGDEDFGMVIPALNEVRFYTNAGDSITLAQTYTFANLSSVPVVVNDLNGDRRPDVFLRTNSLDVTLINNGSFSFSTNSNTNIVYLWPAGGADFDGDGDLDIPGANSSINVRKGLNNGSGAFTFTSQLTSISTSFAGYGDMDGDFDMDLVTVNSNGQLMVLLNQPASSINTIYTGNTSLCPGQVITVSYNASGTFNAGNNFIVQLSDASGSFSSPTQIGSVSSTALSGNISCTIPAVITNGSNYLIRVISDNPALTGSSSTALTISNYVTPTVSIAKSPAGAQCAGTTLTFTATPTNGGTSPAYQWFLGGSPIPGANASTYVTSSLSNGNQISCQLTSSLTCVTGVATSNTITVNVTSPATVSVSISAAPSGSQCAGTNITFTAVPVNGGGAPTYQWRVNGVPVGTSSTTYSSSTLNNGDVITCQLTSSATCVVSNTAMSNSITQLITSPAAASVSIALAPSSPQCVGTNLTFTATPVNGGGSPAYQWYNNGNPISAANASTYSSNGLADGDDITVTMTTSACALPLTSTSNSISVSVLPTLVPSVSIAASANNICPGTNVVFTATPTNGGLTPVYEWRVNGAAQPGFTGNTFNSSTLVNGDLVRVRLTSSANCASPVNVLSSNITMIVNPTLVPSVSISPSATTICAGTSVVFTATPTNGGSTPVYQWFVNSSPVGINQNTYTTSTLAGGDVVTVNLTSNALCASPATVSGTSPAVTINPTLVPDVTVSASSTSICAGASVLFTANPVNGGATPGYQWRINGLDISGATNSTFNATGLVNGDNVSVRMVSSDACASPANATSSPTIITVNPVLTPTVSISSNLGNSICDGQIVSFSSVITNGGASPGYQWKINSIDVAGATSSTYNSSTIVNGDNITLVLTSNATCASPTVVTSSGITMLVNPVLVPTVTINTATTTNCEDASILFNSNVTNQGASPVYQWNINGIAISGASSSTFTTLVDDGDIVTLTLTSNATCASPSTVTSSGINMSTIPLVTPTVTIAALPGDIICDGDNVTFTATPSNQGASPVYNWMVNGSVVQSGSSTIFNSSTLINNDVISCELISSQSCVTNSNALSGQINMTVNPLPVTSSISGNNTPGCNASSEVYSVLLTPGSTYTWNVPSGATIVSGATGPDNNSITVNFSNISGNITVTETSAAGCPGALQTLPIALFGCGVVIDFNANNTTVCAGQTVTFTHAVSGAIGATDMNWDFGTGATPATILGNGPHVVTYNTAGLISVTLTLSGDVNGSTTKPNYIQVNSQATDMAITTVDATCGTANGSIQITGVTGGQSPYNYEINGGGLSTATLYSGLAGGVYIVTVSDNNGCTYSENVTINGFTAPTSFTTSVNNATCGNSNGSITVTSVSGGTPGYLYNINGGLFTTGNSFSGLAGGTYTIGVQDAMGCTFTQTVNVNSLAGPSALSFNVTNATCGLANGTVDVNFTLGAGALVSITFNGVASLNTNYSGLGGGNYLVTVLDANGCSISSTASVGSTPAITNITTSVSDASCGGSNGSIDVTSVTGGTAGYTYSLDGTTYVGTTLFGGLAAGAYTIFVKDVNNCLFNQGFTINNLGGITSITTTVSNASCGGSNGSIDVTSVTGGTPGYTYSLDGSGYVGTTLFSGLTAGAYSIFVKDANNCVFSQGFNVNNTGGPTAIATNITNENCGNGTGSVTITGVTNGQAPYLYNFNGLGFSAGTTYNALAAGTYSLVVQDNNLCTFSTTVTIGNNVGPTGFTVSVINSNCGTSDGEISVNTVTGGSAPYTYSNGGGSFSLSNLFTGLSAGNYDIYVQDNNGCQYNEIVTIGNIGGLFVSLSPFNETCGMSNGGIFTSISGGSSPYDILWSNGDTTQDIFGLASGNYNVVITDVFGCMGFANATINNDTIALTATIFDAHCGMNDGEVDLTASGGAGSYSYFWSNGEFNEDLFDVVSGTYDVTVFDYNGCSATASYVVNDIPGITAYTTTITNASCGTADGSIEVTSVTGGSLPYQYFIDSISQGNNPLFTGLNAGTYTIAVQDSNGCSYSELVTVGNVGSLSVTLSSFNETCGFNNGGILTTISGGSSPYDILWSNGDTTQDIFGLASGNYSIVVTDAFGCMGFANATIASDTLTLSAAVTDAHCGNSDGAIDLTVSGLTGSYSYSWSNGDFNEDIFNLAAGAYDVTVFDYNGCSATATYVVGDTPGITGFSTNSVDATCGTNDGSITVTSVTGGIAPYEYYIDSISQNNNNIFSNLIAGAYLITVQDSVGCEFENTIVINTTPSITSVNTSVQDETCGELNGSVTILSVVGGVAPYSYSFNNSPFGSQTFFTGLNNGIYNYEVLDSLGCNFIGSVTVASIGAVTSINTTITPETCGSGNGSIDVTAAFGGTSPYQYALNSGAYSSSSLFTGLAAGNDTINVKDNNGCIFQQIVTVGGTPAAVASAGNDTTVCENTVVTLTANGGVSYTWDNGLGNSNTVSFIATGTTDYIVEVQDANGCTDSDTVTVTVNPLPAVPVITASGPTTFCFGNSVDLTSSYAGGNVWSTAATTDAITISAVGVYTIDVTQTDANGCSSTSAPVTVTVNALPAAPVITASGPTTFCFGNSVDLTSSYVGGNVWSTAATTDAITISAVGSYTIDVTQTDANGCSSTSAPVTVTVNALPAAPVITASGPTTFCFGNSVDLTSSYVGGNVWSTAATTDAITISAVGVYTIDVIYTDANGCSATSAPISVTVNSLPPAPVITASGPTTFCFGNSVDLTSSYVGGNVWSTAATTDAITISAVGSYTIDVTQTDANGCSSTSAPVTVTVNALPAAPVITASGPTTFCFGNSVDLTSSYVGGNVWSTAATTDAITISAVGVYTIDVIYTDANGCSATSAPIGVTVNALPAQPVITAFGSLVICNGTSVTLASNEPIGNTWSTSEITQSIDVNAAGSYTVTYTDANSCSQTSDAVQVFVNTPVPATLNLPNNVACEGGPSVLLSGGFPVGGNYIGPGIINNVLYPTLLPGGIYTIDYIVNDMNGCSSIASQNFTINASPIVSATAAQTLLCLTDLPTPLSGLPLGGTFSGNGIVSGNFDPSLAGAGIHTITYQFTDANACTASSSFDIIVNPLPQLTLVPISGLCINSGSFSLNNGFPSGGTYMIDGVAVTEINTNTLSQGIHTLTYTYNPANGCGNSITTQFTINALPTVSLQAFAAICQTASPLMLTGGLPVGGTFSGSGVLGGVFYPNLANPTNTILYTYADINGCMASASQTITVLTPQTINFAPLSPVCLNSTAIVLNTASPAGGIYSGTGVISNTFDPSIAGVGIHTINYSVTDVNGCIAAASQTVTVNALPIISTTSVQTLCGNNSPIVLTFAQPVGGIYSGTGVTSNMFDPAVSGGGVFSITYAYVDNNGCADTVSQNVTVNTAPLVTHTNYAATCGNAGLITLNNGFPLGGTYSGSFVSNGQFNSDLSGPGTFVIDYTFSDVNGCSSSASAGIVVNQLPSVSLSSLGNICTGAGSITLNNGLPLGGTYFGTGVTNGVLDPALLPNGTQTLGYTYTDINGCIDSTSITYNIYTLQANAGSDQSSTCTTSALLQGQSNYSGIGTLSYAWSPAAGLSNTNTQNTVATPSSSTNYVLTVSDGVCSSTDTVLVVVSQPNFNLAVTPSAQILNVAPFIVFFSNNTPNPANYSYVWDFGDGTTYSGFQPVYHNYTSNGSFNVSLIATALGSGCIDTLIMSNLITCNNGIFCNDSANIVIDGVLIPNNSNYSTTICANQNFVLGSNTGPNYSYQWYFNGLALQSGLGSTYAPTVSGYYTVGVEDSSCINLSSPVYVTVLPTPAIPYITSTGSNNFCGGGSLTLNANAGYNSYLWSTGSTQNSITINTSGNYWVQGIDANGCYAQSLDFAVNGSNMLPQYICVATVDTLLNENRITWEKPITTSIDSFIVYRETALAGVFNVIGSVDYDSNSEFIDTASSPDINNNRYRLAIKDSCGNMTTQGDVHGTIKTWITPLGNGDSLEIFFTKYIGIDSLSYTLYRGPSALNMAPVGSSYTFNNNANFHSIKDLSPPAYSSGYVYYQVRASLVNLCNTDSNEYHQSISNTISYGNALGIAQAEQVFDVNAFPNPNNGSFNISIESGLTENVNLVIYNQIGEVVWTKQLEKLNGKTTLSVPLEQAAQGVYQLQVTSDKKVINKRLIINK